MEFERKRRHHEVILDVTEDLLEGEFKRASYLEILARGDPYRVVYRSDGWLYHQGTDACVESTSACSAATNSGGDGSSSW